MSAREFLLITQESALNTPVTGSSAPVVWPTASPTSYFVRLSDGNSFSMVANPVIEEIPYGGGFAVTAEAVSDHYECKGQLKMKLYPSMAAFLLGWATTRVDGSGDPWATTEPVGDLASCSIYHAIRRSDGSYKRTQFSGVKVAGAKIEVSRQSTTAMITLDLQACKSLGNAMDSSSDPTSTPFPAPAEAEYPTGPYTFKMTAGGLTIASMRTEYEDLNIGITNVLDGRWFEQSYLQVNQFCGRASTLDTNIYLKPSPDDQSPYEILTAQSVAAVFTNGVTGQNMTLQFNGQNTFKGVSYDLPLNQAYMRKLSLKNRWDPTALSGAGNDLLVSFA
jgi:hypothetical protein